MKVYVVSYFGDIQGIFSTREKARKYIEKANFGDYLDIDEYIVDNLTPETS